MTIAASTGTMASTTCCPSSWAMLPRLRWIQPQSIIGATHDLGRQRRAGRSAQAGRSEQAGPATAPGRARPAGPCRPGPARRSAPLRSPSRRYRVLVHQPRRAPAPGPPPSSGWSSAGGVSGTAGRALDARLPSRAASVPPVSYVWSLVVRLRVLSGDVVLPPDQPASSWASCWSRAVPYDSSLTGGTSLPYGWSLVAASVGLVGVVLVAAPSSARKDPRRTDVAWSPATRGVRPGARLRGSTGLVALRQVLFRQVLFRQVLFRQGSRDPGGVGVAVDGVVIGHSVVVAPNELRDPTMRRRAPAAPRPAPSAVPRSESRRGPRPPTGRRRRQRLRRRRRRPRTRPPRPAAHRGRRRRRDRPAPEVPASGRSVPGSPDTRSAPLRPR